MQSGNYHPLKLGIILNQVIDCKDQSLNENLNIAVLRAKQDWLPQSMMFEVNKMMAQFLIKSIRDSEDENFCHKCLEELKYYAFDIDSVNHIK